MRAGAITKPAASRVNSRMRWPTRNIRRAVIGAVGGPPIVLDGANLTPDVAERALLQSGLDAIGRKMQVVALRRAMEKAA